MTSVSLRAVCARAQPALASLLAAGDSSFGTSVASLGLSGDCSVWCSLDLAVGTDMSGKGSVLTVTIQPPSPPPSPPPLPPQVSQSLGNLSLIHI